LNKNPDRLFPTGHASQSWFACSDTGQLLFVAVGGGRVLGVRFVFEGNAVRSALEVFERFEGVGVLVGPAGCGGVAVAFAATAATTATTAGSAFFAFFAALRFGSLSALPLARGVNDFLGLKLPASFHGLQGWFVRFAGFGFESSAFARRCVAGGIAGAAIAPTTAAARSTPASFAGLPRFAVAHRRLAANTILRGFRRDVARLTG
jgi:hypothetical protein